MRKICVLLLVYISCVTSALAQQNIINIPSSDVLNGGEIILKQSNKFSPFADGYTSLTPQVIVGTGKGTNISVGAGTNITQEDTSVKLNISVKKVFRVKRSKRFTIGASISPSLTEGQRPDSMVYAHGSYLVKKTRTTFTAGGYVAGQGNMPSLTGVMLGVDQAIVANKLRFVADWMSREDTGGSFAVGFKIRPEATTSITTAVLVPNASEDRVAFSISISKYLGKVIPDRPKKEPEGKENL